MQTKIACGVLVLCFAASMSACSDADRDSSTELPDVRATHGSQLTVPGAVAISDDCRGALNASELEGKAGGAEESAMASTVSECDSYDEWLAGVIENPSAMGLTFVTEDSARIALDTICHVYDGPVCVDAKEYFDGEIY
ncbi:hypothetical protein VR010_02550 [Actinomycetaceae bacterium L2_0104]